jgi:hypothetical protein
LNSGKLYIAGLFLLICIVSILRGEKSFSVEPVTHAIIGKMEFAKPIGIGGFIVFAGLTSAKSNDGRSQYYNKTLIGFFEEG